MSKKCSSSKRENALFPVSELPTDIIQQQIGLIAKTVVLPKENNVPEFETYVNWWTAPSVASATISNTPLINGMLFNIAFSNWGAPLDPAAEAQTINLYHQIKQATVGYTVYIKLSYGGATYPCPPLNSIADATALANTILNSLNYFNNTYGIVFDGIDLDLESSTNAVYFISFLQTLRSLLPDKIISFTVPGQSWSGPTHDIVISTVAQAAVNYIQFMEYNIWIASGINFEQQIINDILTYTGPIGTIGPIGVACWGVPVAKTSLGLMPGPDDIGNNLTPDAAQNLTSFAVLQQLSKVMIWDSIRDYQGIPVTGYPSLIFSQDIINVLTGYNILYQTRLLNSLKLLDRPIDAERIKEFIIDKCKCSDVLSLWNKYQKKPSASSSKQLIRALTDNHNYDYIIKLIYLAKIYIDNYQYGGIYLLLEAQYLLHNI